MTYKSEREREITHLVMRPLKNGMLLEYTVRNRINIIQNMYITKRVNKLYKWAEYHKQKNNYYSIDCLFSIILKGLMYIIWWGMFFRKIG